MTEQKRYGNWESWLMAGFEPERGLSGIRCAHVEADVRRRSSGGQQPPTLWPFSNQIAEPESGRTFRLPIRSGVTTGSDSVPIFSIGKPRSRALAIKRSRMTSASDNRDSRCCAAAAVAPTRSSHNGGSCAPKRRSLWRPADIHSDCLLSLSALVTTLTEDNAIAAAAIIGESRMPNSG